jgi:hypothetical protein
MSTIAITPRHVAADRVKVVSAAVADALSDTADVAWRNLLPQLRPHGALTERDQAMAVELNHTIVPAHRPS